MQNLTPKILKAELVFLFILTIISTGTFYFQDSLPDHAYLISSKSEGSNLFTYLLTSLFVTFESFSGSWVFIPFFIFSFFYAFIYSQRNSVIDLFNIFSLLTSFVFYIFILSPNFFRKKPFISSSKLYKHSLCCDILYYLSYSFSFWNI